jgi:membrane-bound lytic murein transglycosylase D
MLLLLKLRMESSLNATVQLGATLIVAETNTVNKAILVAEADVKDSEYTVQKGDNLGNIAKNLTPL